MVEETARKIQETIDRLFRSSPKSSPKSLIIGTGERPSLIGRKRSHSSPLGVNLAANVLYESSSSSKSAQPPICKPWDRDDFFCRLSTFKSITWFSKPQVVSPLECARRGWVNSDVDTITCSSCGARLLFVTPSSWTQQQVEKAAIAFSLKLESGHKVLCPWINNACAEEIAYFPSLLDNVLAEDYKRRTASLSQLTALPAISLSVISKYRSSRLLKFLGLPANSISIENSVTELQRDASDPTPSFSCCQAIKLISLLGWETYVLHHEVDTKDGNDSIEYAAVIISTAQNQRVKVYSLCSSDGTRFFSELQFDPSSVILHCKLCGASVGLWAFNNIRPPLEYLRFVGPEEINGKSISADDDVNAEEGFPDDGTQKNALMTPVTPLEFTIAGGPPPASLDYSPTISLPIVGKNLRSRIADETGHTDPVSLEIPLHVEESHHVSNKIEIIPAEGSSDMHNNSMRVDESTVCSMQNGEGRENESNREKMGEAEECSNQPDRPGGVPCTGASSEFDPIKQHRPFCPWIMSTEKFTPGWQQTLSALERNKELNKSTDSSLVEVRNPFALAIKLLATQGAKNSKTGS